MEKQDIESLIEERQKADEERKHEIVQRETEDRELTDPVPIDKVGLSNIMLKIDTEKSYEEQAQDVLGAMTVAEAVRNEETKRALVEKKSEELKASADVKVKKAQEAVTEAETNIQKASRELNEGILLEYEIKKHLPPRLMKIVMFFLSISYIFNTIFIRIPMSMPRTFIDTLDGIFVRYEKVDESIKPRIKVIGWVLIGLIIAVAICMTVLKILKII